MHKILAIVDRYLFIIQLCDVRTCLTNDAAIQVDPTSAPVKVYSRNIAGAESMSFAQLVKVASRVKLRKTEIPRYV